MPTLTRTIHPTDLDHPTLSAETLLIGTVTIAHLRDQTSAPAALGDDEFVASLGSASPGAPNHVIGKRAEGRVYDRIILTYRAGGRTHQRTWTLQADNGAEAHYRLLDDTGARGGYAAI
jgi:hypothetical protein